MLKNRTKIIYLNSLIALTNQSMQVILGFLIRKIFINSLGVAYLGYNSVFSNILQMLNLADLGIGVAITSFLFQPLTNRDNQKISALMFLYKKIYNIIGIIILVIGLIISIPIGILVPDATCSIGYLRILFLINLMGTVSTYFLAYNRTLLVADQKSYITNFIDMIMYFTISMLQVIILLTFPNYIVFLVLGIAKNIISNIVLSIYCNKKYRQVTHQKNKKLLSEYKSQIILYVKDLFISRIGATIFYGTDNIIISIFRGSLLTGYLSNYTMITTQLIAIINQILSSLQATFGNYIYSGKSTIEQKQMTDNYFCVNYCIGNFCMICFILLAQPFVTLFFGQSLILSFSTVVWLGLNLMLTILIQLPSQVFVIYKLFKYDRPIIIISAILNIIISVIFVRYLGIDGVLIGTFITSLIYLFSRFFVISKYAYHVSYKNYLKKIFLYFMLSIGTTGFIYILCHRIPSSNTILFIFKTIIVGVLSILLPMMALSFTREFKFLENKLIPERLKKFCNKYVKCGMLLLTLLIVFLGTKESNTDIDPDNKSLPRVQNYIEEQLVDDKIFHLSFDDVIQCFEDISENEYDSLFENSTFAWMKNVHDKYGVVISCYVYYEKEKFNLSQCTDKYRTEFANNSDWLRFGFHTINADTSYEEGIIIDDYNKTITELERIVSTQAIDNVIRLQSFKGSYDGMNELIRTAHEPVIGFLTADDKRKSYYLETEDNNYIYCHDVLKKENCYFISTDLRVEYITDVNQKLKELSTDAWNNQLNYLEIFSHEWALSVEVRENIEKICKYAAENGYKFQFFEDVLTH